MKKREKARFSFRLALTVLLVSTMIFSVFSPLQSQAYANTVPTAVDGRVLTPSQTGDKVNWIEIARSGNYSLIVRTNYINWYPQAYRYGDHTWQYISFGSSQSYSSSNVRNYINNWFSGVANPAGDCLPLNARLRSYTMQNNAKNVCGTSSTAAAQSNGFSSPSSVSASTGSDVAFALSFSEVVAFVSRTHDMRGRNPQVAFSSSIAQANFCKMSFPQVYYYGMWTRSPGDVSTTVGALAYDGRVFQFQMDSSACEEKALIYPALWVDQSIWGPTTATVNVIHKDAVTGDTLQGNSYVLNAPSTISYGPYPAIQIPGYQTGVPAPGSDPASGTINPGETKNVIWMYTRLPVPTNINVTHRDAVTGEILSGVSHSLAISQPTSYGPYPAGNFAGYQAGVLASYSDPASGIINPGETKNITWLYSKASQNAVINVTHKDAVTGATLQSNSYTYSINQPMSYGPYNAVSFTGYGPGVLASYSDPIQGTVNPGGIINITWLYTSNAQTSTINVVHRDAQTNAVLHSYAYTLSISQPTQYGPYNAINIIGYQPGVLASYSDPAQGTINPGETKTVTWLYINNMQTAKVNVNHLDALTGTVLLHEEFTFDINQPTTYGHFSSKSFAGYQPGVLASFSDPASGTINPGETKNVIYLYTRAAANAYINVYHISIENGSIIKTDNHTMSISQSTPYGPYVAAVISGYQTGVLAPFGDPASGTINPGDTKSIFYLYAPVQVITTINVTHKDAVTGTVLQSESFTLTGNQPGIYGPYNAKTFSGYGPGTLAPGSDPETGLYMPGDTKNITWLYNRGTATIYVLCINMATNNTIKIDVLNVPAGPYGPITPPSIPGYAYRGPHPSLGDPIQGTVDTNQAKVVVLQYATGNN